MLPYSEACERNKAPILDVLTEVFAPIRTVLEIGSGTGQHAVYFAQNLPHLTWQPSELGAELPTLRPRLDLDHPHNLNAPLSLDVSDHPWPFKADGIFTANSFHIMSWSEVEDFFTGTGSALLEPGRLCVYGPFRYDHGYTSESNARFDRSLRAQAAHMGIREFEAVDRLAARQGLSFAADYPMPANNQILMWQRGTFEE